MLGKPRILLLFPNLLNNSIKHEHSCNIPYVKCKSWLENFPGKNHENQWDHVKIISNLFVYMTENKFASYRIPYLCLLPLQAHIGQKRLYLN